MNVINRQYLNIIKNNKTNSSLNVTVTEKTIFRLFSVSQTLRIIIYSHIFFQLKLVSNFEKKVTKQNVIKNNIQLGTLHNWINDSSL